MNALGILYATRIGHIPDVEMKHVYAFKHQEPVGVEEIDNAQSVNVFKQWVHVTDGKTI
jgi:hypothetical protein